MILRIKKTGSQKNREKIAEKMEKTLANEKEVCYNGEAPKKSTRSPAG